MKTVRTPAQRSGVRTSAFDVYEEEPLRDPNHRCSMMDNVVWTPHIGYVTREEFEIQFSDFFDQIVVYAEGRPVNVVNPHVHDSLLRDAHSILAEGSASAHGHPDRPPIQPAKARNQPHFASWREMWGPRALPR